VEVPTIPPVITTDLYERVRRRMTKNRKWNPINRRYPLASFLYCGHCGYALQGSTTKGHAYYRHHVKSGNGGHTCGLRVARGDRIDGPVLDFLYAWFTDQPAFDMAVKLALPSATDREDKLSQVARAVAELRATEREIANLVDAIAKGVDPALLVAKQAELKATRDNLRQRLDIVEGELKSLPDPLAIQAEATTIRRHLAQQHTGKDWRTESPENLQRFLEFLFGTDPKRDHYGIYLQRSGDALTATIRARLAFRLLYTADGQRVGWQAALGAAAAGDTQTVTNDLVMTCDVGAENSLTTSATAPTATCSRRIAG
jgi:hypothetical protein